MTFKKAMTGLSVIALNVLVVIIIYWDPWPTLALMAVIACLLALQKEL